MNHEIMVWTRRRRRELLYRFRRVVWNSYWEFRRIQREREELLMEELEDNMQAMDEYFAMNAYRWPRCRCGDAVYTFIWMECVECYFEH